MTQTAVLSAIQQELVRIQTSIARLRERIAAVTEEPPANHRQPGSGVHGPQLPVTLTARGAFQPCGFWFRGNFHRCETQVDVYLGLLRQIAALSQDAMPRTAEALRYEGRSRTYLATDPTRLFPDRAPGWARAHCRSVAEGWYADTNLNLNTKKNLVRLILQANGLREGTDVVIVWRRQRVSGAAVTTDAQLGTSRWQ